jgi:lipoic acid synthetase
MRELPVWFTQPLPDGMAMGRMRTLLRSHSLHTVCEGARCPNASRCWGKGTASFMLLGDTCTRACQFCAVKSGRPSAVDDDEPRRIALAVKDLGLKYVVLTSVTRDDLPDEGAAHFARTVRAVKEIDADIRVELLVPDLSARRACFETVAEAGPAVIGHNIETVRQISKALRPQADHDRSLQALRLARNVPGRHFVKSGLMVGLGETDVEVLEAMSELRVAGCDIVTIGQYLAPEADGRQVRVGRFVEPQTFDMYRREGKAMGIRHVFSGPLVRSSFMADEVFGNALEGA